MYPKRVLISAVLGAAAIACTLFAGNVVAGEHTVIVAVHVSAQGLDLGDPAGARTFYSRLENAAWLACTRGNRVNLAPSDDPKGCYEKALGEAVRFAHVPLVTLAYLATHTLREAAAHGIEVPAQVARAE